jgi:sulfatase maturation enzyme AslB (radical SAM superfamily)
MPLQGVCEFPCDHLYAGDRKDFIPIADTHPERDAACILKLAETTGPGPIVVCFMEANPSWLRKRWTACISLLNQSERGVRFQYMVYTSGELVQPAMADFPELIRNIWLYAVSIDGSRRQHEQCRPGTHLEKIHDSLAALKKVRKGTVLMWSTLREEQSLSDCFDEFVFLNTKGLSDQFFWHWVETGEPFQDFESYLRRYEKELSAILEVYMACLRRGRILPIVHINELSLPRPEKRNASAAGGTGHEL